MGESMDLDRQKFFLELTDLFSILPWGGLPAYLPMGNLPPLVLGETFKGRRTKSGPHSWSRVFGLLALRFGAWLDELYSSAQHHTLNIQIAILARPGRPLRLDERKGAGDSRERTHYARLWKINSSNDA
jgi:hypothetical protein